LIVAKRKLTDWDSIEPLYRAGNLSLNDICNQYAADHVNSQVWKTTVTHGGIIKKAKARKWARDIADKVKKRIQEKLVTSLVTSCDQSETDIIEQATEAPVKIALGQRARTALQLQIQDELTDELRAQTDVDVMARVRGFKDIAASIRLHHDQQATQYGLNSTTSTPVAGIDISFVSSDD